MKHSSSCLIYYITNCTRGRAISYTNCYELRVSDNFHTDLTKLVDIHEQKELKDRGKWPLHEGISPKHGLALSPILPIEFIKISSFTQHPSSFQLPMRWRINGGSLFYSLIYAIIFQFLCEKKSSSKQNAHALFTENYTWSVWFNTHLIATRLACLPVLC